MRRKGPPDSERHGCLAVLKHPAVLILLALALLLAGGVVFLVVKISSYDLTRATELKAQIDADLQKLTVALRAYREQRGWYPERLEEIRAVTWPTDALPTDPFSPSGATYQYEVLNDGEFVLLYSVGPDGEPHHGLRDVPRVVEPEYEDPVSPVGGIVLLVRAGEDPDNGMDDFMRAALTMQQVIDTPPYDDIPYRELEHFQEHGWDESRKLPASVKSATYAHTLMKSLLERSRPAMELARAGVHSPALTLTWSEEELSRHGAHLPYVGMLTLMRCFVIEAKWLEYQGHPQDAIENYLAALRLAQAAGEGPALLPKLIGMAATTSSARALSSAIQSATFSEEELSAMLARLTEIHRQRPSVAAGIREEHVVFRNTLEDNLVWPVESLRGRPGTQDHGLLRLYTVLNAGRIVSNNKYATDELTAQLEGEDSEFNFWTYVEETDFVNRMHLVGITSADTRDRVASAHLEGARILVALELYKQRNGHYPETLSALGPILAATAPADPFNAKTYGYLRNATGYDLWSVGPDTRDDGALTVYDPSNGTISAGDILLRR